MAKTIHLIAGSYSDFKIILNSLPAKPGLVFWSLESGTLFNMAPLEAPRDHWQRIFQMP
jgi:hypothetical protein